MAEKDKETERPLNIYERINNVRKSITYIKKDAQVQGYKAVTHDVVTAAVRDGLIEQEIIIVPRLISSLFTNTGAVTGKGNPWMRYEGWYEIEFIEPGGTSLTVPFEAHAEDTGDKAPGKCVSYATKAIMLKLFNIETGVNDESRAEDVIQRPQITERITKEQALNLQAKAEEHGVFDGLMKWVKNTLKADSLEDIRTDKLEVVNQRLDSAIRAKEKNDHP